MPEWQGVELGKASGRSSTVDIDLIGRCIRGEKKAWDTLVARVSQFVYYCIRKVMRGATGKVYEEELEDIFQQVFASLVRNDYRKLRSFKGDCKFTTWLSFVARSVCVDHFRKRGKRTGEISLETLIGDDDMKGGVTLENVLVDPGNGPDTVVQRNETAALVRDAVQNLPARERIIVRLFYNEGKKYREIAKVMNMPINTVSSAISRAKLSLKEKLLAGGMGGLTESDGGKEGAV